MFSPIGKSKHAVSISPLMKSSSNVKEVVSKTIPYSEETLFKGVPDHIHELYEKFRDGILAMDSEITIHRRESGHHERRKRCIGALFLSD